MSRRSDVWIQSCEELSDGSLSVGITRLSSWKSETILVNPEQRKELRNSLRNIGVRIKTVEGLVDSVLSVEPYLWTPKHYVGNMSGGNIIPDMFEPHVNWSAFTTTPVALYAGDYMWRTKWGHT